MPFELNPQNLSRRAFLQGAALGTLGLTLLSNRAAALLASEAGSPYAPFRMGVQSYSLRNFNTDDALAKTQAMGLTYWESFLSHFPITDDPKVLAGYQEKLRAHNIRMLAYGVVDFSADEADARRKFVFAKAMGLQTLTASPNPDSLPLLDKLAPEYNIRVAIHNHGPGDEHYDTIEKEQAALQGRHPLIGICEDTGHRLRSGLDPVLSVNTFGKRVYGVHLKDVKDGPNGEKEFTEVGKGKLNTVALLRALKAHGFNGLISLEYEIHEQDPVPYMEQCLAVTRYAVRVVNGAKTNRPAPEPPAPGA